MNVRELIQKLEKEDPDRLVIMSSDAEGNSYSPLSDVETAYYIADSSWSGEVGLEELTEEDILNGYSDEDLAVGGVPALILCPTN